MSTGAELDEIKLYLLGELPEEQLSQFEERYFADSDFFDRIEAAEDDLIEQYVLGTTSSHERRWLEEQFLVNQRLHQKLLLATAIDRYISRDEEAPAYFDEEMEIGNFSRLRSWLNPFRSRRRAARAAILG